MARVRFGVVVLATLGVAAFTPALPGERGDDNDTPVPGLACYIEAPRWRVGDWFILRWSSWDALMALGEAEDVPWVDERDERLDVAAEEDAFGYDCFVLQTADLEMGTVKRAYSFRRYDLAFLRHLKPGDARPIDITEVQAPGPALLPRPMYFPAFPLNPDERVEYPTAPLRSAVGDVVTLDERVGRLPIWSGTRPISQTAGTEEISVGAQSMHALRIYLGAGPTGSKVVVRWLPGKPWWIQAWRAPGPNGLGYRAALAATSWDTLPLDQVEAMLPKTVGDRKRETVEEVPVAASLWHQVSAYRRVVAVRYARDPWDTQAATIWLLPNKFDEKAVEQLKAPPEAAERNKAARPRVVYLGDNYRALLMSPAKPHANLTPLLKELAAVFEKHPDLTVPEFPLPRAAVGGKILEPD